ncbi:MAG: hypothetical protein LLF97_09380 [Planctomycetaceae bacterium]|nr:hypothetical protein [Planctomycetaceae bacterium]
MRRFFTQPDEAVNSDSFLDIVASVVSIMIIMVVLEGSRIKNEPVSLSLPASSPAMVEWEKDAAVERNMRTDIVKADAEVGALQREIAGRRLQRDVLATTVSAVEQKLQQYRQRLDTTKRADFDRTRSLSESRSQLEQLVHEREQVENTPAAPVVVESYPTPLSRAVDGPEAHLLISNGRVVFVPVEPLLEEFQTQARRQVYKLRDQPELTDTVGPIGGFRLRYTLERQDISAETMEETGRGGSYVRLRRWVLVPVSDEQGEPVRLALQEGSDFRRTLVKILPGRTAVTIWVYPDGFEAFRQIRKELYRLGYAIAARPLPPGTPISGSPDGSKSAAQ